MRVLRVATQFVSRVAQVVLGHVIITWLDL